MPRLLEAQIRYARYYQSILAQANAHYLRGKEASQKGLEFFHTKWMNIHAAQLWCEKNSSKNEIFAQLCSEYPSAGAHLLDFLQHPRERIQWLAAALAAARYLNDRASEARHLGNLGLTYEYLGDYQGGIEHSEQSLRLWQSLQNRVGECQVLGNIGLSYANWGKTRQALKYYRQQLRLARELKDRISEGNALTNSGLACLRLGKTRRAIVLFNSDLRIARETGNLQYEADALSNLGKAFLFAQQAETANDFFQQALEIARTIGDRRVEAMTLWRMSLLQEHIGRREQAISYAESALIIFEQLEAPELDAIRKQIAAWQKQDNGNDVQALQRNN